MGVSVQKYLRTVYRPDRDFVDGVVEGRNTGEYDHARCQMVLCVYLAGLEQYFGVVGLMSVRVRTGPNRLRVPDLCLLDARAPREQVIETPPILCVEILSPKDKLVKLQDRIDDFLAMGVPEVWVIDPKSKRGWRYTEEGSREAIDGVLRTLDGRIELPFVELCMQI